MGAAKSRSAFISLVLGAGLLFAMHGFAAEGRSPQAQIYLEARLDAEAQKIIGKMHVVLPKELASRKIELKEPTWSDLFGVKRDRLSRFSAGLREQERFDTGKAEVPRMLMKILNEDSGSIRVDFETNLEPAEKLKSSRNEKIWVLASWHPILKIDGHEVRSEYSVDFELPADFKLVLPNEVVAGGVEKTVSLAGARAVVGVLARGVHVEQIESSGKKPGEPSVTLVYRSSEFNQLTAASLAAVKYMRSVAGRHPSPGLVIAETAKSFSYHHEGLVPLQFPTQAMLRRVISEASFWHQWQLSEAIAQQWFGASLRFTGKYRELAANGLGMFFADHLFSESGKQFQNLNREDRLLSYIRWTYQQHLFGMAGMARNSFANDINENGQLAAALIPVRLAVGMMHASRRFGEKDFLRVLESTFQETSFFDADFEEWLKIFIERLEAVDRLNGEAAGKIIQHWTTKTGWWDPAIESCHASDNGDLTVEISQKGELKFPVRVVLDLPDARIISEFVGEKALFSGRKFTKDDCRYAVVDGTRDSFDENRFNNKLGFPGLGLFPVTVRTIKDDAYSIAWIPMATRRSGQPWLYGAVFGLLRYTESGAFAWYGYSPAVKSHQIIGRFQTLSDSKGYSLRLLYKRELTAAHLAAIEPVRSFSGGFGEGEARVRLQANSCARTAETGCATQFPVGASFEWKNPAGKWSHFSTEISGDVLAGLAVNKDQQRFTRSFARMDVNWEATKVFDLYSRLFVGDSQSSEVLPDGAYFDPQEVEEAGMRVDEFDRRSLLSEKIMAATFEWRPYIPYLKADVDAFAIVTSKARLAVFADWATAQSAINQETIRLFDYGIGVRIPIGGDVGGAGTAVFGGIAADVVLQSRVNDRVTKKPSLLFSMYRVH